MKVRITRNAKIFSPKIEKFEGELISISGDEVNIVWLKIGNEIKGIKLYGGFKIEVLK